MIILIAGHLTIVRTYKRRITQVATTIQKTTGVKDKSIVRGILSHHLPKLRKGDMVKV